jgi:LCP family protein required for cell wall assembly
VEHSVEFSIVAPLPPTRERPVGGAHTSYADSLHGALPGGHAPQPKRKRRWIKRVAIILVVIMAMVAGAAGAAVFLAKQQVDDFVLPHTKGERATAKQLVAPVAGKPTNILVIGSDHREGDDDTNQRSDTMMLVRLNPEQKNISVMSFPRDLYVNIPGHGQSKINDSYTYGGAALTVQTIKEMTGQDINFSLEVDFDGFKNIVDQFDGIFIDVDRKYFVAEGSGHSAIDIAPGYQRLQGRDALAFARHRISDSDFHRIARQQMVLASLKKQIAQSGVKNHIPALLGIMNKNVRAVGGGGKGVPLGVLKDYITLGLALDGKDVYEVEYDGVVGTAGKASIVEYEPEKMRTAVAAFLNPNAKAREETANQLVGTAAPDAGADEGSAKGADTAPDPSTVTVTVRNGSGVGGVASNMAGQLNSAGYQVVGGQTNADNQNYANTRVQYRAAAGKAAAEALAARIEGATAEQSTPSNTFDSKLLVIVGKTGTSIEGEAGGDGSDGSDAGDAAAADDYAGNRVPEKAAAKVTKDAEYGRDLFSANIKPSSLKFPLLFPTVRAEGSTYDDLVQYTVVKGKSVYSNYRLVADTGTAGEYWGLQGTNWPDPPILEGATREVVRAGRTYKLYFNGTKLHMVAWRQGAGVYWVSNTILNKLSNETMLAIAQGAKLYR